MMWLVAVTYMFCIGSHVHLVYIVNMNDITGTIPSEMGTLLNLQYLHMYCMHGLIGSIPTEFGSLSQLVELKLCKFEF